MDFLSGIIIGGSHFLLANPDGVGSDASNWPVALNLIGQFFFLAAVFAFIIFLAVYSLRIASRFRGVNGGNNNLRVIESRSLGGQNFIHIVKAGSKYFAVGSSKENVAFFTEIDGESINDIFDGNNQASFEKVLSTQIKKLFVKQPPPEE